jgi:hypothetical protein
VPNVSRVHRPICTRYSAAVLVCTLLFCSAHAGASEICKPRHALPTINLKDMGVCDFNLDSLSYRGTPEEQARCLMRGEDQSRNLGPPMDNLPDALASRVGRDTGLPSRETLGAYLSKQDLEWTLAVHLWQPVSHAEDNNPEAPLATYFVIHDTSGPNYGHREFPDDIDSMSKINNLKNFDCADGWGVAHVVVNRTGDMLVNHDFATPWRETKFERAADFVGTLKGLFLHVEMIQPRRSAPGHSRYNDAQPPTPAFTTAQYDRLALLYTIASVRAGRWLIPAYHAAIDAGIPNGHDDPRGFDAETFGNSLTLLMEKLHGPEAAQAAPQ